MPCRIFYCCIIAFYKLILLLRTFKCYFSLVIDVIWLNVLFTLLVINIYLLFTYIDNLHWGSATHAGPRLSELSYEITSRNMTYFNYLRKQIHLLVLAVLATGETCKILIKGFYSVLLKTITDTILAFCNLCNINYYFLYLIILSSWNPIWVAWHYGPQNWKNILKGVSSQNIFQSKNKNL